MLGSQERLLAIGLPLVVGGFYYASRARLRVQWREELMDLAGDSYPPVTMNDMEFFRRVTPAEISLSYVDQLQDAHLNVADARRRRDVVGAPLIEKSKVNSVIEYFGGVPMFPEDNIGLSVQQLLKRTEINMLLDEVKRIASEYGIHHDEKKVELFLKLCQDAMEDLKGDGNRSKAREKQFSALLSRLSTSSISNADKELLLEEVEFAKTRALDVVRDDQGRFYEEMLIVSDHAIDTQVMKAPWGSGDSIKMEKVPSIIRGLSDKMAAAFPGVGKLRHVYIEYSPTGKLYHRPSCPKAYDGHDYVILPLRRCVLSDADLLGSASNQESRRSIESTVVTISPVTRSQQTTMKEIFSNSWTSRDVDALIPAGCAMRVYGPARYMWSWGLRPANWFGNCRNVMIGSDSEASHPSIWSTVTRYFKQQSNRAEQPTPACDSAVIVLHFEGPRSKGVQRRPLLHPESLIYGEVPKVESFDRWVSSVPSADDVHKDWIIWWVIKNYFEALGTM